eukprot:scaffold93465_cov30-Tisochrysis_lutea.AAC.3
MDGVQEQADCTQHVVGGALGPVHHGDGEPHHDGNGYNRSGARHEPLVRHFRPIGCARPKQHGEEVDQR